MRKNSVRKFIHAILDLLPLFVIPIFAIYSMNHEIEGNNIHTNEYKIVDFNQLFNDGDTYSIDQPQNVISDLKFTFNPTHLYQLQFNIENYLSGSTYIIGFWQNSTSYRRYGPYSINSDSMKVRFDNSMMSGLLNSYDNCYCVLQFLGTYDLNEPAIVNNIEVFDLSQTFGVGSEPSFSVFESFFPDDYYNATISTMWQLNLSTTIIYDDNDIMSQFVYVTYNAVDKYFNMGNVFNMNGVYDWFVVNIFGGNAPISMFIVWNVVLYEFVMDLLMLLYGLFMWFIDMIEKLMSKPLDSIK